MYGNLFTGYSFEDFSLQLYDNDTVEDIIGSGVTYLLNSTERYSNVGVYTDEITIDPSSINGPKASKYHIIIEPAALTITAREITIQADDKSKWWGTEDPQLTYTIVSGSLAGSDQITGELTRDAGEFPGTYTIRQGTLAVSSNYQLTFINGTLTINDF